MKYNTPYNIQCVRDYDGLPECRQTSQLAYSSRHSILHSNRNISHIYSSISNNTSPHQHMGGPRQERQKAVKFHVSTSIHPSHRIIQPKRNDNLGNAAQDDAHPPECRVTDRSIPIAMLHPMISAYLNTGKSGIWHSSLDLFFLTECEVALLLESPESRDTLPGVRSERHCIVCR